MVAMEASGRDSVKQSRRRGGSSRRRRSALQEPRSEEGAKRGHGDGVEGGARRTRKRSVQRVSLCILMLRFLRERDDVFCC